MLLIRINKDVNNRKQHVHNMLLKVRILEVYMFRFQKNRLEEKRSGKRLMMKYTVVEWEAIVEWEATVEWERVVEWESPVEPDPPAETDSPVEPESPMEPDFQVKDCIAL